MSKNKSEILHCPENPVFGRCIYEVTFEDVVKSMITDPDKWTKEQIIDFLKENILNKGE